MIQLIPQPKSIRCRSGSFEGPAGGTMCISDQSLYECAQELLPLFPKWKVASVAPGVESDILLETDSALADEAYRLTVGRDGIVLSGGSVRGVFWGCQTLLQIARQNPGQPLPRVTIEDEPDIASRAVYLDVTRGRVPTLESFIQLAEFLSRYKVNELQIYLEHTFRFRGHPDIGRGASPMTAEEILELDRFCRERHIELVPSFASFGHMANILKHRQYNELAEDRGRMEYVDPDAAKHRCIKAWSLAPANPDIYPFLDSLFAELLPLFSSKKFNACCDETWDLCLGQSYELGKRIGKGRVYLNHIKKLNRMSHKYGKKMQIWGDIIREHPGLIPEIPRDVTVLDWNYSSRHPFHTIKDFKKSGLPFYACPGVASWRCLFPRIHEAAANIAGFAAAAKENDADGLLNTDWGDGGHFNFMEFSWHGYLCGAEQAWNTKANQRTFTERFCREFIGSDDPKLVEAVIELGDVAQLEFPRRFYQSIWQHIFFATVDDPLFDGVKEDAWTSRKGRLTAKQTCLDADFGRDVMKSLARIRRVFMRQRGKASDPAGILPYWIFAVDTLSHAARKLTVLAPGGRNSISARNGLRKEMKSLIGRFQRLWTARSKRSEIRITLKRYRKAIDSLGRAQQA